MRYGNIHEYNRISTTKATIFSGWKVLFALACKQVQGKLIGKYEITCCLKRNVRED